MAKLIVQLAVFVSVLAGLNSTSSAQDGETEYKASCATCHGEDGRGKGPFSSQLKVAPTDLTVLTNKNSGVFPVKFVYEVIDGRQAVLAHGTRDMPIWGNRYSLQQIQQTLRENQPYDPEVIVRTRILAIIDYLNRIQSK